MKNIQALYLQKFNNPGQYTLIEEGVYMDISDADDTNHRLPISIELEEGEDSQYPLEDILDKFYLHVTDFLESESLSPNQMKVVLAGELEDIQKAKVILGKRVYNKNIEEDGKTYVRLVIE